MAAASTFRLKLSPSSLYLEAKDITCSREGKYLFKPVSFDLKPGDVLHVKGPNAVGKTSLLRALCGLGPLLGGVLKVNNVLVTTFLDADFSFQFIDLRGGLHPALTVGDHLEMFKELYGAPLGPVDPVFERHLKTPVSKLSSGLRQLLTLKTLNFKTPLWLLDEPFVSLDEANTASLRSILQMYQDNGGILIIVSHGAHHEPAHAKKIVLEAF